MGTSQITSDRTWLLICDDAKNLSHHWQLERERDGSSTSDGSSFSFATMQ
jgi:hypothetical protein